MSRLLARLLVEPALPEDRQAGAVGDCLRALERQWVESQWHSLQRQLAQPGLPREKRVELQQRVLDLRKRLDHITTLSTANSSSQQVQA